MSHYLVTGGAGFIGSNIVEKLLKEGETVTVLDNFSTGKHENLQFSAPVRIIEGDIRALEVCIKACRSADYVLHQAALGSVPRSTEDPLTTHAVNVTGTLNMLIAAQRNNVRRFIFASSSSVYGDQSPAHAETDNAISAKVETMTPHPRSPYAVSKLAGEYYCKVFSQCFGLETISLRYFNVFGKRQDPFSQYAAVIPLFFKALLHDQPPHIFGDGNQSRDFTFIANFVEEQLRDFRNPKMEKILEIARMFSPKWEEDIRKASEGEKKDAIDSIVANRNRIAHGEDVSITFSRINNYYANVIKFIELMNNRCNECD